MRLRSCFPLTSENLNKVDHQRCRERLGGKKKFNIKVYLYSFSTGGENSTLAVTFYPHTLFIFTVCPSSSALHLKLLPPTSTVSFLPLLFTNKRTHARTHARTHTDIPWHLVLLMLDGGCHGNTSLTLFLVSLAEKTQKLTQEAEEVQGARIIRSNQWRPVEGTEVIPRLSGSSVLDCQKRDLGGCCCPVKPKVNCDSTHKVLIKHDLLPHPTKLRLFHVR